MSFFLATGYFDNIVYYRGDHFRNVTEIIRML